MKPLAFGAEGRARALHVAAARTLVWNREKYGLLFTTLTCPIAAASRGPAACTPWQRRPSQGSARLLINLQPVQQQAATGRAAPFAVRQAYGKTQSAGGPPAEGARLFRRQRVSRDRLLKPEECTTR